MTPEDKALAHLLAERLMGWWLLNTRHPRWTDATGKYMEHVDAWNPASRWDHAGMVADAMRERGWVLTLDDILASWQAIYTADMEDNVREDGAIADTAPRAIAEAARAALEGEQT